MTPGVKFLLMPDGVGRFFYFVWALVGISGIRVFLLLENILFFDFLNFRRQLVTHCISLMGLFLVFVVCGCARVGESGGVLEAGGFKHYVDYFNETDDEIVVNHIANSESWAWLEKNVPLFECSDKDIDLFTL